ncbi:hypothetical protein [Magnetospirillum fulvum]|jgi:hypothetical protein|uniref:Lipoprotein n=1 Tax=Magnetospirillum fulvum TaxID=1082 RepID=A0A1H6GV45_MAGFU|nr:hypothetical protein [Magnetospirillum fulvum]SEH26008.1 hypothetical protein SAMN04244559_00373 [Magnetospirillum fulvum]
MKSQTVRLAATLAVLLPLLAQAGCTRSSSPENNGAAPGSPQLVTDIPLPSGAGIDQDRSLILSDRDRWTGRVVMVLTNSANDMTNFYQTQMPGFGWQPLMSITSETSILTYLRGDRAATVQIERRSVLGSIVTITVAPRQADGASGASGGSSDYTAPAPRSAPAERIRSEPLPAPSARR